MFNYNLESYDRLMSEILWYNEMFAKKKFNKDKAKQLSLKRNLKRKQKVKFTK